MDALYLQLFQAMFPQFDFENIEQGKTEEEMAQNIDSLIKLLEKNILETDLSQIKGEAIVSGNLVHIDEFLQVLLQVVFLMAQNQDEGEESEESLDSKHRSKNKGGSSQKKDNSSSKKEKSKKRANDDKMDADLNNLNDEIDIDSPDMDEIGNYDAQKLFGSEGKGGKYNNMLKDIDNLSDDNLHKEDVSDKHSRKKSDKRRGHADSNDEMDDENEGYSDLDFYGKNIPDKKQVIVNDEDEEALLMSQEFKMQKAEEHKSPPSNNSKNDKGKKDVSKPSDSKDMKAKQADKDKDKDKGKGKDKGKEKIDVLNDPLLPEGVDFGSKKQKRQRADSLGGRGGSFDGGNLLGEHEEDDDDLLVIDNLDELDEEQKYMVLQHLFEEYQKNPDSFPEDQKQLLEHEMMKLYQKAEMEGELDDDDYEENSGDGRYGKEKQNLSSSNEKKPKKLMDDSDTSDKKAQKDSNKKAKPRMLKDDKSDEVEHKEKLKSDHRQKEDEEDEKYMKEIVDQKNKENSPKKEQKPVVNKEEKEVSSSKKNEDKFDQEMEEDGEGEIEYNINEEEFNKLSPEEQQKMLMMMQMQQEYAQQHEMEGEGDQDHQEVNQEYLNALHQQMINQNVMPGHERQKSK